MVDETADTVGCFVGLLPTLWTLLVPALLLGLVVVFAKRTSEVLEAQKKATTEG